MHPFLLLLALQPGDLPSPAPVWNEDYLLARQQAATADKPLAVLIGLGAEGWRALTAEGELGPEARRLLAEKYVCVYIDASRRPGYEWARAFDAEGAPMLILSDRHCAYQAFRHAGTLPTAVLVEALRRFGPPDPLAFADPLAQATCPT